MRNKKEKKEKRRGGGREGLLRKQNSRLETHRETQKLTGTPMPTERHANTQRCLSLLTSQSLFPVSTLPWPSLARWDHRHRNLVFFPMSRAARLSKASYSPASNSVLAIQELCASGNPLSGPGFYNCHMRRLLRPTLQGWWEEYKAFCARAW